jgi:hypothetical protein
MRAYIAHDLRDIVAIMLDEVAPVLWAGKNYVARRFSLVGLLGLS